MEDLLDLPCTQHQYAEEWISTNFKDPDEISLSGHEIFREICLTKQSIAGINRPRINFRNRVYQRLAEWRPRIGSPSAEKTLEQSFHEQVERWKTETGHWSSILKMIAHPSYLRIIGLAAQSTKHKIETLLLRELQKEPDYWFYALTAITGEDPVQPGHDFDEAVTAWLEWGHQRGLI